MGQNHQSTAKEWAYDQWQSIGLISHWTLSLEHRTEGRNGDGADSPCWLVVPEETIFHLLLPGLLEGSFFLSVPSLVSQYFL